MEYLIAERTACVLPRENPAFVLPRENPANVLPRENHHQRVVSHQRSAGFHPQIQPENTCLESLISCRFFATNPTTEHTITRQFSKALQDLSNLSPNRARGRLCICKVSILYSRSLDRIFLAIPGRCNPR